MLAEVLERTRDQVVDELDHRAAITESTELPIAGRRRRLSGLIHEIIEVLRRQGVEETTELPAAASTVADPALELRERELVRGYLIEQVEQKRMPASPGETVIVAQWVGQAERARLRDQNTRLRALLDSVQESAAVLGPDGRILYCNRRAARTLREATGVPRPEIVGKTPAELGVPGELLVGRPIEELVPLARQRQSFEMNAWGRDKEGRFEALYRIDGSVGAVMLVVRDVHARKLAETRLDLLTKLSALTGTLEYDEVAEALVHIPIPQFADWCVVNVIESGRIRRTFLAHADPSKAPLRDEILRELPAWEGRHPLWQEMLINGFQLLTEVNDDMLRRMSTSERQYHLLSRLGMRSLMVVPMVSRGRLLGILSFAYTVDSGRRYGRDDPPLAEEIALHAAHAFENARLMKDLKASEERFRIALGSARTAVYEQDTSLRYVWYYNPLAPLNLVGKTAEEGLPPDEAGPLTEIKRRVLEEGERVEQEMDLTFGGELRRHYRDTVEPLRDQTGKIVGVIGAATDITEQQRTQQQLTAELDFRERMMGILGHDLRNPLGTVIMAADLLLRGQELPATGRSQLVRLRRAAGRMQEMIDTLLDFTRARFMGSVPVSRVPGDLAEISRGAIEEMHLAWPDYAIELEVRGDARGEWDPARMSQTITNLVTNALSYGRDRASVHVTIEGDTREVDVKVHNHGQPIAAEAIPMLFEPFRRGVPEDRSPGGLGLGLYIVKQIVEAHDGSIGVESTEQAGTTFTLHLPRGAAKAAEAAPA
jgi:PAS domain S-box-containing protein